MHVIKVGGRAQREPLLYERIASQWRGAPGSVCIVHGGGDEVTSLQRLMGAETVFVDGRRVTSAADIDLLRMGLSGVSNKRIVSELQRHGTRAIGLSGEDGALIVARRTRNPKLGLVGEPESINADLLRTLLAEGYLPVISPVGWSPESGMPLNINGDDAAAAVAVALRADELLLIADVSGVMEGNDMLTKLSADQVEKLVGKGAATGGMIAKLEASILALGRGVGSVRIGSAQMIIDSQAGTTITLTPSMV
jgi:acetylglutamate kinase